MRIIIPAAIAVLLTFIFQNCGRSFIGSQTLSSSNLSLPFAHPSIDIGMQGDPVSGQLVMGDRLYLESVFRDIFSPPGSSANVKGFVDAILFQEFSPTQNMLGRACDVNQDGLVWDCGGTLSNVDIHMSPGTSSIREAARIQVCRIILANDVVLNQVVDSIKTAQSTPNTDSITNMIYLFFPAGNFPASLGTELLSLDATMSTSGETVPDRWRLLLLTLCESPAWQVL